MTNTCNNTTACVGTLLYLAPELLKTDHDSSMTTAIDVYSFAIIMW